jgi:hypothetical protein
VVLRKSRRGEVGDGSDISVSYINNSSPGAVGSTSSVIL